MYGCHGNGLASALGEGIFRWWGNFTIVGFIGVYIYYMQSTKIPTPSFISVLGVILTAVALIILFYLLRNILIQQGSCWIRGG